MYLSDVFDQLMYGELSQLHIGGDECEVIKPENYAKIAAHVNLGLSALHTRFLLREDEVILQQYSHITDYRLHSDFAQTNTASNEPYKYIIDSPERPFTDNIIKIETVYDEGGCKVPLNNPIESCSVYTPAPNTLQVPAPHNANSTFIMYRAEHDHLIVDEATDLTKVCVNLPRAFLEALLYYIASRHFTPLGATEAGNVSMEFRQKYEAACAMLELKNIAAEDNHTNTQLEVAGWV